MPQASQPLPSPLTVANDVPGTPLVKLVERRLPSDSQHPEIRPEAETLLLGVKSQLKALGFVDGKEVGAEVEEHADVAKEQGVKAEGTERTA